MHTHRRPARERWRWNRLCPDGVGFVLTETISTLFWTMSAGMTFSPAASAAAVHGVSPAQPEGESRRA